MASTFCMSVNCTILEFKYKIKRLKMMAKILVHDFEKDVIHFPRTCFLNASFEKQEILFEELSKYREINEVITIDLIKRVLNDAKETA